MPASALAAIVAVTVLATARPLPDPFPVVVERVAGMVRDPEAQRLAREHGLQLLDLTWEDTGRSQGSSVGPNISDVTIEVLSTPGPGSGSGSGDERPLGLMPVLRFPNFSDRTADVRLDKVWLRVGNEREGGAEQVISLRQLLAEPGRWLSAPAAGAIRGGTLLAPRDSHALVSAQAAFLPVPQGGAATFHPVIFNYQSSAGHPAVLSILVTRQGTSLSIVDNARDAVPGGRSWGQRLFFNAAGQRAPLTAERLADVRASGTTMNGEAAASLGEDANLLLLIQVPLKLDRPRRATSAALGAAFPASAPPAALALEQAAKAEASDLDVAVLGHGALEGPFTELAGLTIERDPAFPVRVTAQFYQATASGRVGGGDLARLAALIEKVYAKGDYVGSLVVPGPADAARPTRWRGDEAPPASGLCAYPGLAEFWGVACPSRLPPVGIR
jgi:hypothetical protein